MQAYNPLLSSYDLPPFATVRAEHLAPAIEKILADSRTKVAEIISSQTPLATWDDLVLAMDDVKARLDETLHLIDLISSVTTHDTWLMAAKRGTQQLTTYKTELAQNRELSVLYENLANSPAAALFDSARQRVLQQKAREFRSTGIHLPAIQLRRVVELKADIQARETAIKFHAEQTRQTRGLHINDELLLGGLPQPIKMRMAAHAQQKNIEGWWINLSDELFRSCMLHAEHRSLRQALWMAHHSTTLTATLPDPPFVEADEMALLLADRHELANLLGYDNFAHLALEEQMAETPDQVLTFMRNILKEQRRIFDNESMQLHQLAPLHGITDVQPWDYEFLAEKIRQQHAVSPEALSEYFALDTVLNRLYQFAQIMFGIELLERSDFEPWQEDVRLIEVREHGEAIGYLFIDPYQRAVSDASVATLGLRNRRLTAEGQIRLPIAVMRFTFTPGTTHTPCLLEYTQLRMVLHEFGHGLQHVLTGGVYGDLSGLKGLGHDSQEFASQVMEQWCFCKEFVLWMSSHYQTGASIPEAMIDRQMTLIRTQTSWATAHLMLNMLFDFELHRSFGDGRTIQQVFDELSAEVGHLHWPSHTHASNTAQLIAATPGARTYSYKWSGVLASAAFELFVARGVFDPATGRAFRVAFFTQGTSRSLLTLLEVFLGDIYSNPLIKLPNGNGKGALQADGAVDETTVHTEKVSASQQLMLRLNNEFARPSDIATQHLNDWLKTTFPSMGQDLNASELSLRTFKNDPEDQANKRTVTQSVPLITLFWHAIAGHLDTRTLFLNLDDIELVHTQGDITQVPAVLNSNGAKIKLERLLVTTLAVSYQRHVERAFNDFWDSPAEYSQERSVSEWLALQFSSQLRAQVDLHLLDTALSPDMHKAVTDYALSAPDAHLRKEMTASIRPGVYRLSHTPEGWGFSVPIPCAVVFTQHDDESGQALLYRLGEALEVYTHLNELKIDLTQDGDDQDQVHIAPLTDNFLTCLVNDLRKEQKAAINHVLLQGPQTEEDIHTWVVRLDAAADIGTRLDLAGAMDERELRLSQKKQNDWLNANTYVTGADRLAWWKAVQDLHSSVQAHSTLPPDPVMLGTPDALRQWTRTLLTRLIAEKYDPADPDQILVGIEKNIIDPHAPKGSSPFDSGVALHSVPTFFQDLRSMTEWAMSNLTPDERNALHPSIEGPLSFEQIVDIIERANVGARLAYTLPSLARERQAEWMSLKEKQMRAQLWSAHISGDLIYNRDNTELNLVLAALDSPSPLGRNKVNGHEVVVHQFKYGASVIKDLIGFGVASVPSRPSLTLYTPHAPDGKMFRTVEAQNTRGLRASVAHALTATPEMARWMISHLPLTEQAEPLISLTRSPDSLSFGEKLKTVTQSIFYAAKRRFEADLAIKMVSAVVEGDLFKTLHETQLAHALQTADVLTVTNAERNSSAAQEGRIRGVTLITGVFSLYPTGRLGGILARSILPVMAGGAAISAIQDEGGSFSQWAKDFISGLGEVLAEAGQDLIMAKVRGRRRKTRPPLSRLVNMTDPQLKPYRVDTKQWLPKDPIPLENGIYQERNGLHQYVKAGADWFLSRVPVGGKRIIYHPTKHGGLGVARELFRENGAWRLKPLEHHTRGGMGGVLGRTPQTPEQKTRSALLEGILAKPMRRSAGTVQAARDLIDSMPDELVTRLLEESMAQFDTRSIERFRQLISDLNQGRTRFTAHEPSHRNLIYKYDVWHAVDYLTKKIKAELPDVDIADESRIKLFDLALPLKNTFIDKSGNFNFEMGILNDKISGAKVIVLTGQSGKSKTELGKLIRDQEELKNATEAKSTQALVTQLQLPETATQASLQAINDYLAVPQHQAEHRQLQRQIFREEMSARNKLGLLTEIRSKQLPYFIVNKGIKQPKLQVTSKEDVNHFFNTLTKYTEPFETQALTKTTTHKVTGSTQTPETVDTSATSATSAIENTFRVETSALADTQMAYENFPEAARTKVNEVMEDIRAGRVTTKKIRGYYWYDMAQLDPGTGRGAWRAAFERRGNTWELQGFYDYHRDQPAAIWGE